MSVLTGKLVLIVGEENSQINKLKDTLNDHGVLTKSVPCVDFSSEIVDELKADFIFLNYLGGKEDCKGVLNALRMTSFDKLIPSFILVEDSSYKIQEVISYGATDYVTPEENAESTLQKIRMIFTENNKFTGSSAIDITPVETSVTSEGVRVYIVEDDPLLRNLLSMRLKKSSFSFEFSKDGRQIIPIMKQFKPDVVILDLMLPGVSGFDVLAEIKADDSLKETPVIVFSNRDGQDDRQKAQTLGASAFYVKAMTDLSELVEKIETLTK